jgi:hypothetical protein
MTDKTTKAKDWEPWLKGKVRVRWQKHLPRLVLLEKYEKRVKWALRVLTLVGIGTSLLTLPSWYVSLGVAVLLVLVEQFLEKSVFCYTSLYVQPLPGFAVKPDEWLGMVYMYPPNTGPEGLNGVGLAFKTTEYAADFFNLLRAWNYGQDEDTNNNICLSFIIENEDAYSVYLYPSVERESIRHFQEECERGGRLNKPGKEHFPLIMQMVFHKMLPYSDACHVNAFVHHQKAGQPFWLVACALQEDGSAKVMERIGALIKHTFKYKRRCDLTKTDWEYGHGKRLMGL